VPKPALRPLAVLLAALTLASPAVAAPVTWKVDPAHTEVGFDVRHFFTKVHGVFHDTQGTIVFDEQDPTAIKVDASARVASVDTGNRNRDSDLQTPDFFNAATDSILSFRSTKVEKTGKSKYKVTGDLTMRGVTKQVVFDAEFLGSSTVSVEGKSWGAKAGFSATTVVNRQDYGIKWNKALDNGGMMVGDDVTITLNIEGSKAQ
jgi:polyisoprenoid-binding protein YceI